MLEQQARALLKIPTKKDRAEIETLEVGLPLRPQLSFWLPMWLFWLGFFLHVARLWLMSFCGSLRYVPLLNLP